MVACLQLEGFRAPKSFAVVVEALLERQERRAALALLPLAHIAGYTVDVGWSGIRELVFRARVAAGELELERGEAPDADATIRADPMTLGGVMWQHVGLNEAERAEAITVEGDRRAAKRFLGLFPLSESAPTV